MINPHKLNRKIEIHIIKNYPYSNLNRDEFGTPKTFMFGGFLHGRISSQSLKRSWREYFRKYFSEDISIRTKALPDEVRKVLEEEGKDEEFIELAVKTIKEMFVSGDEPKKNDDQKKKYLTAQIIPLTPAEILFFKEEFSRVSREELEDKKSCEKFTKAFREHIEDFGTALDIALWGRMVTSPVIKSTEAAMQVAHAISTRPVTIEDDFFSAVDDIIENGAAHIDTAEYDSCCFYEYGCIDYELLVSNLGGDEDRAKRAIPMIIRTLAYADPSGKNTTTGTNTLPSVIMIEMKSKPYNLSNAFIMPTDSRKARERETGCGAIVDSVTWLSEECVRLNKKYGIEAKRFWFSVPDVSCECAEEAGTFDELIEKTTSLL